MKKKFLGLPIWLWLIVAICIFFWQKLRNLYYLIFKKGVAPYTSTTITWSNWWTVTSSTSTDATTGSKAS